MQFGRRKPRRRANSAVIASSPIDQIDDLRAWVLGLPFVRDIERPHGDTHEQLFIIDCPLMHIREAWLLIRVEETECELVVARGDGDVTSVGLTPSRPADRCLIEAALLASYDRVFAAVWRSPAS